MEDTRHELMISVMDAAEQVAISQAQFDEAVEICHDVESKAGRLRDDAYRLYEATEALRKHERTLTTRERGY